MFIPNWSNYVGQLFSGNEKNTNDGPKDEQGKSSTAPPCSNRACLTICIIGGGNSRKLPVSVKGVNSFTCTIINIETIGGKSKNSI